MFSSQHIVNSCIQSEAATGISDHNKSGNIRWIRSRSETMKTTWTVVMHSLHWVCWCTWISCPITIHLGYGAHRLTVAHARNNVSPKLDSLDPSLIIFQVSVPYAYKCTVQDVDWLNKTWQMRCPQCIYKHSVHRKAWNSAALRINNPWVAFEVVDI